MARRREGHFKKSVIEREEVKRTQRQREKGSPGAGGRVSHLIQASSRRRNGGMRECVQHRREGIGTGEK